MDMQDRLIRLKNIAFAVDDFIGSFKFLTDFLDAFVLVVDDLVLVLSQFEYLLEFLVVGLLDAENEVFHHDDLVALGIVREQLK
jgi:hypothetical protein